MKALSSDRDKIMKLLSVLIAAFMVSGAMAQKAPNLIDVQHRDGYRCSADGPKLWSCKNAKTGNTLRVRCKNPSMSIMPPKDRPTAKLKKACGLLDGLEDIETNG